MQLFISAPRGKGIPIWTTNLTGRCFGILVLICTHNTNQYKIFPTLEDLPKTLSASRRRETFLILKVFWRHQLTINYKLDLYFMISSLKCQLIAFSKTLWQVKTKGNWLQKVPSSENQLRKKDHCQYGVDPSQSCQKAYCFITWLTTEFQ